MVNVTPQHLTSIQYAALQPNSRDSTLTKKAKRFIADSEYCVTPIRNWSATVDTITKGKTKEAQALFTPTKNRNAIYRWKVEVLEGDKVVTKRLIGMSSSVKKRLSSYYSAIRSGQGSLAKLVLKSLHQRMHTQGLSISFGVTHSNVPPELLGRVEKLLINVQKASSPEHLINKRAGGGGSSQRKPLSHEDVALVHDVATKILSQKSTLKDNLPAGTLFKRQGNRVVTRLTVDQRLKHGVVYDIENIEKGKHYVGKTQTFLSRRLSQHISAVNTLKRAKRLHHAINKHPENFVVRVLYQAPASQRHILEEVEHAYILALGSHAKKLGYNDTKGNTLIAAMASELKDPELLEQVRRVQSVYNQLC